MSPRRHAASPDLAGALGVALTVMAGLGLTTEAARHAMNRLPPDVYLPIYYRRWLGGIETALVERGFSAPTKSTPTSMGARLRREGVDRRA